MNLGDMIKRINARVDDVVSNNDAVGWLNDAKDIMGMKVDASFPDIAITSDMSQSFVFSSKYHIIPVLYASAKFKEQNSSIREANNFMGEFNHLLNDFISNYVVPVQYRDDEFTQQFTATNGQTTFQISKEGYSPTYGRLKVYVNNAVVKPEEINSDKTFKISARNAGDLVTAVWEDHNYTSSSPFSWWTF